MRIDWKGQSCFNIACSRKKEESLNLLIDAQDYKTKAKLSKQKADILVYTNKLHKEGKTDSFLIKDPGEYEINGAIIRGVNTGSDSDNIIYTIELEKIKICHLGRFNQKELTSEQLRHLGDVDILMIPVGGGDYLDANRAADIVNQIDPKIIIPMYFKIPDIKEKLDKVDDFLKAMGHDKVEPIEKLLIKAKDISEHTQIIVLKL